LLFRPLKLEKFLNSIEFGPACEHLLSVCRASARFLSDGGQRSADNLDKLIQEHLEGKQQ